MIQHQNTLVSFDIFEKKFICHLDKCLGACCVEGDYGAPLEEQEIETIEKNLGAIRPFMTARGRDLLKREKFWTIDPLGQSVTNCILKRDCIFVFRDKGINYCSIEKAWNKKETDFQKPISCHLYPIRLGRVYHMITLNYNKWSICDPALLLGKKMNTPLYIFLKPALVRKFGQPWYDELVDIAKDYLEERKRL